MEPRDHLDRLNAAAQRRPIRAAAAALLIIAAGGLLRAAEWLLHVRSGTVLAARCNVEPESPHRGRTS